MGQQDHGDDPSPETIRLLCLFIRAGWTEAEEQKRWTGKPAERYSIPEVSDNWLLTGKGLQDNS